MAVYDVTIAYKDQCLTFLDNLLGVDPSKVHMHIRCIPLKEIPKSEKETVDWLMNTFLFKDQLLSNFIADGQFPRQGTEGLACIYLASASYFDIRPSPVLGTIKEMLQTKNL
ncbi:probable 1-acyl-sn-glycerol-3-phosphate acyltransferase 4 [Olea europaea subsp. europaea]|uniref:1-acylglycerol-3-phosphate O-acyltransferase n=1 Tax=Olea europaea subsp. europaea TaxID=158383 RepID=A0A8S0PUN7_OLEEU|nr:probable 1-acyl-sn-glycerol-3-phosphate acyltransferase 4 [Olea europaea subsp. europaea]